MNIVSKEGTLVEIYAQDGYILDMGDGTYETYICVPSSYDISSIKEISIDDLENKKVLEEVKERKIQEIANYDISKNVNEFFVDGLSLWIPRETRVSLQNSTEILIKNGIENVILWQDLIKFELPCNILLQMLDAIEIYALKCFNVTAEHKANVMKLENRNDVEEYDFTIGYPEKLKFTLK